MYGGVGVYCVRCRWQSCNLILSTSLPTYYVDAKIGRRLWIIFWTGRSLVYRRNSVAFGIWSYWWLCHSTIQHRFPIHCVGVNYNAQVKPWIYISMVYSGIRAFAVLHPIEVQDFRKRCTWLSCSTNISSTVEIVHENILHCTISVACVFVIQVIVIVPHGICQTFVFVPRM